MGPCYSKTWEDTIVGECSKAHLQTDCANCKCSYLVIKANLAGPALGSPWLAISSMLLYWLGSHKNVSL